MSISFPVGVSAGEREPVAPFQSGKGGETATEDDKGRRARRAPLPR